MEDKDRTKFVQENKDVFEGTRSFKGEYNIKLKEGSISVARPARRVPLVIKEKLKIKLGELEAQGIISKAEASD